MSVKKIYDLMENPYSPSYSEWLEEAKKKGKGGK